jgi:putative ABC transport system permease protein
MTIAAVTVGYLAVNVFWGYTISTFTSIQESAVYNEGLGHITICGKGFLTEGKLDPSKYLISFEQQQRIENILLRHPSVKAIIPLLGCVGLISNGKNTPIFIGKGISYEADSIFRSKASFQIEGSSIVPEKPNGCLFGKELAHLLKLQIGDIATIMGMTVEGQMNALDIEVTGIFNTGVSATNDKFIQMPLPLAQSLCDTRSVDRLSVLLNDVDKTWEFREWLEDTFRTKGFEMDVRTWDELSINYKQVRGILFVIFGFIFLIVIVIVLTSVINTMVTSVVERTQEIGTLRALGIKRKGVRKLFGMEGLLIGLMGLGMGVVFTFGTALLVSLSHIRYIPPSGSDYVLVSIELSVIQMLLSGFIFLIMSWAGAFLSSHRVSKMQVVNALGHV